MLATFRDWLLWSDAGLALRVAVGVSILAAMAAWELVRKGRHARRWREHVFLAATAAAAMAYGIVNDQATAGISWECFYYGKEFNLFLGPEVPPSEWALRLAAARLGLKAGWTPGLLIGVAMLLANNPRKGRPQLPHRRLYRLLLWPLAGAIGLAAVLGAAGCLGLFARMELFGVLVEGNIWRPARFMAVWGIHLGGYVGGAVGAMAAAWKILRERRLAAGQAAAAPEGPT